MAKLFSFTICDSISNVSAGAMGMVPTLVSPQIVLRPQYIPGNFSFGIAIGISEIDLNQTNKMRFTITNPKGEIVHDSNESELPIPPEGKGDSLPAELQGFMMCIDIRNLAIPCEGVYIFSIFFNGENIASHEIPIYKGLKQ